MKPNNEFTSPDSRFFYPVNNPIEFHESVDTASFPAVENIPGEDHYVIYAKPDGSLRGAELYWGSYNLAVGTTVVAIKGSQLGDRPFLGGQHWLTTDEIELLDDGCSYAPKEPEATQMIVQLQAIGPWRDLEDIGLGEANGVMVLPYGKSLPSFADEGMPDEEIRYRLLGFINPSDKLVTWRSEKSYTTQVVDWCVLNRVEKNNLEKQLFRDDLPSGAHLGGLLSTRDDAAAYLHYYDKKHGTSYFTTEDPRGHRGEFVLTATERDEFRRIRNLAHSVIGQSRP